MDITQDYDSTISAVGLSFPPPNKHTSESFSDPFEYLQSLSKEHSQQINLLKIDASASVIFDKTLTLPNIKQAVTLLKTPNDGYFIGGYTNNGFLRVLKLDNDANILYNKTFGTKNHNTMAKLIPLQDGGVLSVGSSYTSRASSSNIFKNGLGLNDIFLTRFSKDTHKLWSKKYGSVYDDIGIDAVEADDGSIIVLSQSNTPTGKVINITRITQNGDKIWKKVYKDEKLIAPKKIIKLRNGNFLLTLSQQNTLNQEQIRLIKFDLSQNTLLDTVVNTSYPSTIKDLQEYTNGNIAAIGYVQDSYNRDGLFMVLDANLKMLCQEHFGDENFDTFNALTILHNSQVAVAGIHTDENSQESNMWILKLNDDCTLSQKAVKTKSKTLPNSTLYDTLLKIFKKEIDNNQLIITKDLKIKLIAPSLYFRQSQYKLSSAQEKFLQSFSKKLMIFLQNHKEYISALEVNGHTSSEWGNANFTQRYLNNEKLSMQRAFSVMSCIFRAQDDKAQHYLSKIFKGSGLSFSKRVFFQEKEDKKRSRRISFDIILKDATHHLQK